MGDIKVMVDAGKANAGPPLGPALAPTGVNIGQVVAKINEATLDLSGMKVPVKIVIRNDKTFDISVGLPPTSALIKKELNVQKGAGNPKTDVVGNLTIDQAIKLAKKKYDSLNSITMKSAVKEILGVCNSMGVSVEGKRAKKTITDIDAGKFDEKFN
jgi:large subunit ribosomal protein L11